MLSAVHGPGAEYYGESLPRTIQPGSNAAFNIPRRTIENTAAGNGLDLARAHIVVYFAARKPIRDRTSIAERLGKGSEK